MLSVKNILRVVVSVSVIVLLLFYGNNIFNSYQLKINSLTQEVYELNNYIHDLVEYIENTPDTVIVESISYQTRTVLRVDTVLVEKVVDYYSVDSTLTAPFSLVDKKMGTFVKLEGYSIFEWNMAKRKYVLTETILTNKLINLNLSVNYLVTRSNLDLLISSSSTEVSIMHIENRSLDLSRVYIAEKSRWGLGVVGGVGLLNTGFTPFIGVGVTYQFMDLSFKK